MHLIIMFDVFSVALCAAHTILISYLGYCEAVPTRRILFLDLYTTPSQSGDRLSNFFVYQQMTSI